MESAALTTPQRSVLEALAALQFATSRQLTRFAYSPGSYTSVADAAKKLTDLGYVDRTKRMMQPMEKIYYLKEKGRRYLAEYGLDTLPRVPRSIPQHWLFQEHALAINDVQLAAREVVERTRDLELVSFQADRVLRRHPITVQLERPVKYIPDAWFHFTAATYANPERSFVLEVDRGTEEEDRWRRKIETIIAFSGRPVFERFGTRAFTVAVAVIPVERKEPEKRCQQLMDWTKRELTQLKKEPWGGVFLYSTLNAATVPSPTYFFGEEWRSLMDGKGHALLES